MMGKVANLYVPSNEELKNALYLKNKLNDRNYMVLLFATDADILYADIDGKLLIGLKNIEQYVNSK